MRKTILNLIIFLALLTVGCSIGDYGGGIAGGGMDSKKDIEEANNYQRYISSLISEQIIKNQIKCDQLTHFDDILRSFSFNKSFFKERIDKHPVELTEFGLTASFQNHEFLVQRKEKTLIKEHLPTVFKMPRMNLGIDKLTGTPVIMVVNRSRASTGRYFVAIYMLDGTPLYKNVLIAWQVKDINRDDSFIDILGCGETRRLTMRKP